MNTQRDNSLLLIHGGALGDFVLAVTLARALARALGLEQVRALCRCRVACALARRGLLAGWKSLENPAFSRLFVTDGELPEHAARVLQRPAEVLSMLGSRAGVPFHRLAALRGAGGLALDPAPRQDPSRHIVEQWQADLSDQGVPPVSWEGRACSAAARPETPGDGVILHPGSGGREKCWPLERFLELADVMQSRGAPVHFMVGPVEREWWSDDVLDRLRRAAPLIWEPDVCDAAARLAGSAAFVGNDSGMTHLAALLGLPTVALFTTTSPVVWRPLGPRVTALRRPTVQEVLAALDGQRPR